MPPAPHPQQARLDELTRERFAAPLLGRYTVRPVEADEWPALSRRLESAAFPAAQAVEMKHIWTQDEADRWRGLQNGMGARPLRHRLAFEEGGQPVGCFTGEQDGSNRYYMMFTALVPEHQGNGLYSAFLAGLLDVVRDLGFTTIWSRHHADNNRVLVPKLKAGFVISAFEVAPNFGLLVHLRRYLLDRLQALYEHRVDATRDPTALIEAGILGKR